MADQLPSPLRVPYKTVNTTQIPTDVHIPSPEQRDARYELAPVLIMIHGGGWCCGHSSMNNVDQIADSVARGWIVLSIEHRLCPGVNVLEGPMADARDCLAWAQTGGLSTALEEAGSDVKPDPDAVMAMGTSAGGHLALNMVGDPPLAQVTEASPLTKHSGMGRPESSAGDPRLLRQQKLCASLLGDAKRQDSEHPASVPTSRVLCRNPVGEGDVYGRHQSWRRKQAESDRQPASAGFLVSSSGLGCARPRQRHNRPVHLAACTQGFPSHRPVPERQQGLAACVYRAWDGRL